MKPTQAFSVIASVSALVLVFAAQAARAGDDAQQEATRLGEHPAVLIARRGVQADPAANFYPHPARLLWSLERPLSEGEHPAVLVARHEPNSKIDPNGYILGHPAGGAPKSAVQ
jgi:hypothetical protein